MIPEYLDARERRNTHYWNGYAAGQKWAKSAPKRKGQIQRWNYEQKKWERAPHGIQDLEYLEYLEKNHCLEELTWSIPPAEWWWCLETWKHVFKRKGRPKRMPPRETVRGFIEGALDMWIMTPCLMDWPKESPHKV